MVSARITSKEQTASFRFASVAVKIILVVTETIVPGAGSCVTFGKGSQLSNTDARPV